jgi:N-acetylglucosaminyldiphosphoundecaprenol N-acetyl-beta-D-mannosaminyltransferase
MSGATSVLGCRVDACGVDEAVARILELARGDVPASVITLGTEMVVRARRDPSFRSALNASALSLCDTVGVLYAARARGLHLEGRVTGIDLLDPLCAALAREGLAVYLLGAKGDTAARAGAALAARHPGLRIAGARDGYFGPAQDDEAAATIRASGARVLLVGLGSPRQELWVADHLAKTGALVGIGVGGSFDVLAGNVERAPEVWRRLNVEWLYRLMKEPWRWRRQLALPALVLLALQERLTAGRGSSTA